MATKNEGSWLLEGTQSGIDDVFSPQERAAKLTRSLIDQNAAQLKLDEAFATSESRTEATNAQNDNLTSEADALFNSRIDQVALDEILKPFTEQTQIDAAAVAAQAASFTRSQYDLGLYEAARHLDGSAGLTRREILGVATQDPSLSFGARAEAKRIMRGQDIVDTQQLAVTSPDLALNQASQLGLVPQKIISGQTGEDEYSVTVGTSAPQRLDRRGVTAMFNDLMQGNTKEGDKYRAEQDKAANVQETADTRAATSTANTRLRQEGADRRSAERNKTAMALPGSRMRAKENTTYITMPDGTPISEADAKDYLRQPEIVAFIRDPKNNPLSPNTMATVKAIAAALKAGATKPGKPVVDGSVGARGQRLVDPITGK